MRIRIIWVGKTKEASVRDLTDEYLKRLSRFTKVEVTELRESVRANVAEGIEEEGQRILGALSQDSLFVLLDVDGRQWSSADLAVQFEKWQITSKKEIAFVIGGHNGVSDDVVERADIIWSLSLLTFTHEMARVVLAEQIYRAYTIIKGLPYQR